MNRVLRSHRGLAEDGDAGSLSCITFVLIDLDKFKSINDRYGHAAGDEVIRQVADVLLRCCRASDFVVRWGGEEFLVVELSSDRQKAFEAAERIRRAVGDSVFELSQGLSVRMTCSLGVASFPLLPAQPEAVPWEQVVNVADAGLYTAKLSGRNATVSVICTQETRPERVLDNLAVSFDQLVESGQLAVKTSLDESRVLTLHTAVVEPERRG